MPTATPEVALIPDAHVWLVWSSAFLIPWALLYLGYPEQRRAMLWSSVFTTPFGLTEPLFVPEYWSPPSLFGLARSTGFDIESLIFCFAIGGVGAVITNVVLGTRPRALPSHERHAARHRFHRWSLTAPFLVFAVLYWLPWNPIYPGIVAMLVGAAATVACRPDLVRDTALGAGVFLVFYLVFLTGLELTAPGYIERTWNLDALSGWTVFGFPVEEPLFALAFGAYWAGVYEHFTWHHPAVKGGTSTGSESAGPVTGRRRETV